MWLIVGLGNPGPSYARNRHNAGFMALDTVADETQAGAWKAKYKSELANATIAGQACLLAKPQTFMNLSGESVQAIMGFHKIPPANLLVLHDELDLPLGKLRLKQGGGHGGHNGLRSIDGAIGREYWRLRIGIGHPRDTEDKREVHDWVLSNFSPEERTRMNTVSSEIARHLPLFFTHSPEAMMSKLTDALGA